MTARGSTTSSNAAGRWAACLACLAPLPAAAQDEPSFDCAEAENAAEELVCSDSDLARLDRLVADRYAAALEIVRSLDAGADTAEDDLRARQRGWIGGRDECWKASDLRECVEASYLVREGQIVARYLLEDPSAVARWACDGNAELATAFFDTELPSVRLEYGDTVDTGSLTRTASGSRYEASFGSYIWLKGDEAMFRTADPEGATLTCTKAAAAANAANECAVD